MSLKEKITQYWVKPAEQVPFALKALSKLFAFISSQRKKHYQNSPEKVYRAAVPIVVVGNIFVGGTGKTPLVIALVELLRDNGIKAGVISRGYGAKKLEQATAVFADSDPANVGDEPVLIAMRAACPVVVHPKRSQAIEKLLAENNVDVIISDDGLQHYAMARDVEIVVIDGQRQLGNELLLPAGPLREPTSRLESVDYCVVNGGVAANGAFSMELVTSGAYDLHNFSLKKDLRFWSGKQVNAIAGIGNPSRFFDALKMYDINTVECSFPDHYQYKLDDLCFSGDFPILMTEKDAVKCRRFPQGNLGGGTWVVPIVANLEHSFKIKFVDQVTQMLNNRVVEPAK